MSYTIRDVYTNYLSNRVVVTPPATNVEFVAGEAETGDFDEKVSISDIETAKAIFTGGPLLKAIEERLNAGSTRIYAYRIQVYDDGAVASAQVEDSVSFAIKDGPEDRSKNGLYTVTVSHSTATSEYSFEFTDPSDSTVYSSSNTDIDALITAFNTIANNPVEVSKLGSSNPVADDTSVNLTLTGGHTVGPDYFTAIDYSEQFPEINWVHFLGACTDGLWSYILTSCENVLSTGVSARWAILDLPEPIWGDKLNPSSTEVDYYITNVVKPLTDVRKDKNAVVAMGYGKFVDSNGEEYTSQLGSFLSGTRASVNSISKSTLGESRSNLIDCTQFTRAHQETMIENNLNHVRFQPGVGYIWALSNNNAEAGSPYNRIEKVQAVYAAGLQIHAAAVPHLGRPNDEEGEGLLVMEQDLKRPLDMMVKNGEIDSYELQLESDESMREQGQVKVYLTVNSMKAFEFIIQDIFLV